MPSLVNLSFDAKTSPNSIFAFLERAKIKRPSTVLMDILRINDKVSCMLLMERQQVNLRPQCVLNCALLGRVCRHDRIVWKEDFLDEVSTPC